MGNGINEFYDINKFPAQPGITVLGISIPLITNRQSPSECIKASKHLISKIRQPTVGAVISYTDGLYMNSDEKASILKRKFEKLIEEHKKGYLNMIGKNFGIIPSAFSFVTWNQIILECPNFNKYFEQIKKDYLKDKKFQFYVKKDITSAGKKVNQNTINYILEEVLLDYLISRGVVRLRNDFVMDKEKWILNCYHGKSHRTHVYFYNKNSLGLKSTNIYKNSFYDLKNLKLYDFDRLDLETFDFS